MSDETIFDPQFLSRLRVLFFKLRRRRQLRRKGIQSTPDAGSTREFKDHRHYTFGDDYRGIDWLLYARHERLFVKVFEEVKEYHLHIVIDRSNSMADPYGEKRLVALRLAVALAYLGLMNQHRVSLYTMTDSIVRELRPLRGQGHIHEILRRLEAMEFGGVTDLPKALGTFRPTRDRRGITFLLSDLFGQEPERTPEALRHTLSWPTETHLVQIYNPRERQPDIDGEMQLIDVETDERRRVWLSKRDIALYVERFDAFMEEIGQLCTSHQIDRVVWTTDQPFEDLFLHLLMRGSALAGT